MCASPTAVFVVFFIVFSFDCRYGPLLALPQDNARYRDGRDHAFAVFVDPFQLAEPGLIATMPARFGPRWTNLQTLPTKFSPRRLACLQATHASGGSPRVVGPTPPCIAKLRRCFARTIRLVVFSNHQPPSRPSGSGRAFWLQRLPPQ